jgi:hypothetical protein
MTEQQQPMTRAERAEQIAFLEALAEQAKKAAAVHRAAFETGIGDEYRREKAAPTWRVPDFAVISGRVKHAVMRIADPADFLAWMKAHRPDDVEQVERVKPTVQSAILKGCTVNGDGLVVTAGGDEIAGVEFVPGGAFEGIAITFEKSAKEAYAELARNALEAVSLKPAQADQPVAAAPFAGDAQVDGDPWSKPVDDPWSKPAPDPWATTEKTSV